MVVGNLLAINKLMQPEKKSDVITLSCHYYHIHCLYICINPTIYSFFLKLTFLINRRKNITFCSYSHIYYFWCSSSLLVDLGFHLMPFLFDLKKLNLAFLYFKLTDKKVSTLLFTTSPQIFILPSFLKGICT